MKISKLTTVAVLFLSTTLFIASCKKEGAKVSAAEGANESHLPANVLQKAKELDVDPMTLSYLELPTLDGDVDRMIVVDGHADAGISVEDFLGRKHVSAHQKQYRSTNIVDVDAYPTITIFAYSGLPFLALDGSVIGGLDANNVAAVTEAITRWNAIDRSAIQLEVVSGTLGDIVGGVNDNITIFGVPNSALLTSTGTQLLGLAEFPSANGDPGFRVRIAESLATSNDQSFTFENLVKLYMHEIGHCLGLRHTDWDTRASCGANQTGETPGVDGVHYIYGTLPSLGGVIEQENSLMNACPNLSTPGEFNFWDKRAVQTLYPAPFDFDSYQFGGY